MIERAKISRHPERDATPDAARILAEGRVAHVGFCEDGAPFVIPFAYHYDPAAPDRLYLHGAGESRALRHLASGAPVCVTVTLLDGLVYSRDALFHSMNYRSVVCFGRARAVETEATRARLLERMVARHFPGRTEGRDYAAPTPEQIRATRVVEVQVSAWSAKVRTGGPRGPGDADPEAPGTCGVLPRRDPGG